MLFGGFYGFQHLPVQSKGSPLHWWLKRHVLLASPPNGSPLLQEKMIVAPSLKISEYSIIEEPLGAHSDLGCLQRRWRYNIIIILLLIQVVPINTILFNLN